MPNIDKLDELVAWATIEDTKRRAGLPSEWDQGVFINVIPEDEIPAHCGTACCLAGKTVLDAGAFPAIDIYYLGNDEMDTAMAVYSDGTEVAIDDEAKRLLDLNRWQAAQLFHAGNTLEHVVEIVEQIKAGNDEPVVNRRFTRED